MTRLAINRSPDGSRGATRSTRAKRAPRRRGTSPSTRTGSRATTRRRRRSSAAATSCTRTRPTATCSRCSWSDDGGLTWSTGVDIGARPAVGRVSGRSGRRASSSWPTCGSRPVRDRRLALDGRRCDLGRAGPDRAMSPATCAIRAFAPSRCRPRTSTRAGASGSRGTTARRPERRQRRFRLDLNRRRAPGARRPP